MKYIKRKAFTLIEISIVLVIIGIILASVMKGRDLIKSSQIKEFNQVFVSQWETIANSYFSRMAEVLADGGANGGTASGTPDGFMDGGVTTSSVTTALKDAGIDVTELVKSDVGDPYKRGVDGEFTGKSVVEVDFSNFTLNGKHRNYLVFENVPGDVGLAIDTMKDGTQNGKSGSVLSVGTLPSTGGDLNSSAIQDWNSATEQYMLISLEH